MRARGLLVTCERWPGLADCFFLLAPSALDLAPPLTHALPRSQVWQNGQKAEELVGASKENLEKMVTKYSA